MWRVRWCSFGMPKHPGGYFRPPATRVPARLAAPERQDTVNHARVYGFGEVVLTNDASKLSRRRSTAGSRGLHPSRNVAARDGLQAMTGLHCAASIGLWARGRVMSLTAPAAARLQ